LDIAMAQEELWVYETLLKVIRNTNDVGSDPKHDPRNYKKPPSHKWARIKRILALDIGREAVDRWTACEKRLFILPADAGGADANSVASTVASRAAGRTGPGVSPLVDRYVDDMGKPVSDSHQPYGEFSMMPINLKVVMEQKEIPRFLAECANSAMRIDIRRVRILVEEPQPADLANPDAPTTADAVPATVPTTTVPTVDPNAPPTAQPTAAPSTSSRGRRGPRGRGSLVRRKGSMEPGTGTDSGEGESAADESADPIYAPVTVEVQGIIYIYNPPPVQKSGETAAANSGQAASAAPNSGTPANAAAAPGAAAPAPSSTNANPTGGAQQTTPAATAAPTNPPTKTPASGGRP
jgi:hypothetical protein